MATAMSSPPPFQIRNLDEEDGTTVRIRPRQYDQVVEKQPDANLMYLDEDDGEIITVGSGPELYERLMEPAPVSKYSYKDKDLKDNPMHVFEIKEIGEVRNTWRNIANMAGFARPSLTLSRGESKDRNSENEASLHRLEGNARRYLAMARDSLPPSTSAEVDARDRWLQACQPPKLEHGINGSSWDPESTTSVGGPKQRPESSTFERLASTLTAEGERKAKEAGKRLSWHINSQTGDSNTSVPSNSENRWATYRMGTEDGSPFLPSGQRLVHHTRPYTRPKHDSRLVTQAEMEERMREFEANLMSKVEAAMERLMKTIPPTSSDLEAAKEMLKAKPSKMSDVDLESKPQGKDSAFTDTDKVPLNDLIKENAATSSNPEVVYKVQEDNSTSTDPVSRTSDPTIEDVGDIVVQAVQTVATGVGMLGSAVSKKLPELEERLSNAQQNLPERIDSVVSQAIGGIETRTESLAKALQQASDASLNAAERARQADLNFDDFLNGFGGFVYDLGRAIWVTPSYNTIPDDSINAQETTSMDTSTNTEKTKSAAAADVASQPTSSRKNPGGDPASVEKEKETATDSIRHKERDGLTASNVHVPSVDSFFATKPEVTAGPSDLRRHHSMAKLAPSHIDSVGKDRFPNRHSHSRRQHEHANVPRTKDVVKSLADQYRHRIQHMQSTPTLNHNMKSLDGEDDMWSSELRTENVGSSNLLRRHMRDMQSTFAANHNAKPISDPKEPRKDERPPIPRKLVSHDLRHDLRHMQSTPMLNGKTKPILDQEDPDPDFSARYPSLLSSSNAVRRSNTTTGNMSDSWYLRPLNPESEISRFPTVSQLERHDTPKTGAEKLPAVPKSSVADSGFLQRLPGAWPQVPDIKPISKENSKPAAESSGAFFERMTGRRAATFEDFLMEPSTDEPSNLRRAHTTAGNTKRNSPERVEARPLAPPVPAPRQTLWSQSQFTIPRSAATTFHGARRPYSTHYTGTGRTGPLNSIIQTSPPQRQSRPRSLHIPSNPSAMAPTNNTGPVAHHVPGPMGHSNSTTNLVPPHISTIPVTSAPTVSINVLDRPVNPIRISNPRPPQPPQPITTTATLPSHHPQELHIPEKDKVRSCVQHLRMLGYDCPPARGPENGNDRGDNGRAATMERLWLYARMTEGNLEEAIELIEEERRAWKGLGGQS